jgi:hypothetical protein
MYQCMCVAIDTPIRNEITNSAWKIGPALAVYCFVGTMLTLVNKVAIQAFPAPNMLLILQNGMTVLFLQIITTTLENRVGKLPHFTFQVVLTWTPLVILFVGMLLSSLVAIQHVITVFLIVMRNLTTLSVAFFEFMVLGTRISTL